VPAPSRIAVSLSFALALAGCNRGASVGGHDADPHAPDAYAVRGAVTYQDKAVTDGQVTYAPADGGGKPITAKITDGSYELRAPEGRYKVTITGKAGDAELPADLTVERAVRPDTNGNALNLNLPQPEGRNEQDTTPEDIREMGTSKPAEE
jgi:hypothetical protein